MMALTSLNPYFITFLVNRTAYRKLYKCLWELFCMKKTVTILRTEYERLKMRANIDIELLEQLIDSFKDIRMGRIRRVK